MTKAVVKNMPERLLHWFDNHGRKHLPWQQDKTPYRVWVSEIMLQQTQVNTVIAYFTKFIATFPTLDALAEATEDEVLHLWTGLGYYSRARNLHRAAKKIIEDWQGQFPNTLETLETLPGIGASTAGAILSLAFEKRAPILDGNVKRVLTRLHGITTWANDKETLALLWQLAEKYTPTKRAADYTQAIMDLGATLCTRSRPNCAACPFMKSCVSYKKNLQAIIPASRPKKSLPIRKKIFLMISHQKKILLEKRPATGVWAKLWSLPEIAGVSTSKKITLHCRKQFKLNTTEVRLGKPIRHTFSHFHLDITPAFIKIKPSKQNTLESKQHVWYNTRKPPRIGLPQPVKKLLQTLDPL